MLICKNLPKIVFGFHLNDEVDYFFWDRGRIFLLEIFLLYWISSYHNDLCLKFCYLGYMRLYAHNYWEYTRSSIAISWKFGISNSVCNFAITKSTNYDHRELWLRIHSTLSSGDSWVLLWDKWAKFQKYN